MDPPLIALIPHGERIEVRGGLRVMKSHEK